MAAGAENDLAFKTQQLGKSTMAARQVGRSQRGEFSQMALMIRALRQDGFGINPDQIVFDDPVDQSAWSTFVGLEFDEGAKKRPLDPPMIEERDYELRVVGE